MTKEELKALGLTDEVITKILDDQNNHFVPLSRFNEVNEAKKALDGQMTDRDNQLKELKKMAGSSEELKTQIEKLQQANKDQKTSYDKQLQDLKIDGIVNTALLTAKAKNAKAVKAMLKMDKYELDGDKVKGLDDAIAAVKKESAWAFEADAAAGEAATAQLNGLKPAEGGDNGSGKLTGNAAIEQQFGNALNGKF